MLKAYKKIPATRKPRGTKVRLVLKAYKKIPTTRKLKGTDRATGAYCKVKSGRPGHLTEMERFE